MSKWASCSVVTAVMDALKQKVHWNRFCPLSLSFDSCFFLFFFPYRQYTHTSLTSWQCTVKRWVGRTMKRPCHTWTSSSSKYIAPDVFTSPNCFDYAGKSSVMRELPHGLWDMQELFFFFFLPEWSTPPTGRITAVRQQNI